MHHLRTLVPTDFVFRTGLILSFVVAVAIWLSVKHPNAFHDTHTQSFWLEGLAGIFAVTAFDLFLRRGYAVSYDNDNVYWRKVGFHRASDTVSIRVDEITEVAAVEGSLGIEPFEAISIKSDLTEIEIILSRQYLKDDQIRELLGFVGQRAEITFDDDVRKFAAP